MDRARLAEAHRSIGEAEHGVEQRMLDQADRVPDPGTMRERARKISEGADRHLDRARRLDGGSGVEPRPERGDGDGVAAEEA